MSETMTFAQAAHTVLDEANRPMHYKEITQRALDAGLITTSGKTPWETMNARLCVSMKNEGTGSPFVRTTTGTFALRTWAEAGDVTPYETDASEDLKVRTPHMPRYHLMAALLPVWDGHTTDEVLGLRSTVDALTGTPQNPVDWSAPDAWIPERLDGDHRALAEAMWKAGINPRYITGYWLLAARYGLLDSDRGGPLRMTARGEDFRSQPTGKTVLEIDDGEGLLKLLSLVAALGPGSKSAFMEDWGDYLDRVSKMRSDASKRVTLGQRLRNLHTRGLIGRDGYTYAVTHAGLDYLRSAGVQAHASGAEENVEILTLAEEQKEQVRQSLRDLLHEVDPYAFEHIIRRLLEEMNYQDVEVTKASNDKGVDVIGTIEVGIATVREVIQAKRTRGNVQRPVLDQLRGALHRWGANRGTIITTASFSKGTREAAMEAGAAPITLIDGDRLVKLLIDHGIGVRKKEVVLWELDASAFETEALVGEA